MKLELRFEVEYDDATVKDEAVLVAHFQEQFAAWAKEQQWGQTCGAKIVNVKLQVRKMPSK